MALCLLSLSNSIAKRTSSDQFRHIADQEGIIAGNNLLLRNVSIHTGEILQLNASLKRIPIVGLGSTDLGRIDAIVSDSQAIVCKTGPSTDRPTFFNTVALTIIATKSRVQPLMQ